MYINIVAFLLYILYIIMDGLFLLIENEVGTCLLETNVQFSNEFAVCVHAFFVAHTHIIYLKVMLNK